MRKFFDGIGNEGLLFSFKAFLGAVLALSVALYFDLPRPYWAMGTAYIVAQPLAGAVTSKALYRVLGTFIGAVAVVALVPNLVNAPELLCLALALWVGLCLFISQLDRTPRSYAFMLAGYTAAIIGFPSVAAPDLVFDTALARVEEITIGILCTTLISRIIFPRHVGPLLTARIETWLQDAGQWAGDILSGQPDATVTQKDRRRLATDTVDMLVLTTHLSYDTSVLRYAADQVRALQQRMTALLPLLSGIGDRMAALRRGGEPELAFSAVIADIARWISSGPEAACLNEDHLRQELTRLGHDLDSRAFDLWSWRELLMSNLLARLSELVKLWADCIRLRQDIATGKRHSPPHLRVADRYAGEAALHLDIGMALWSGISAVIGTLLCCFFWIASGWQDGVGTVVMGAVFCSVFAFMDNPVPMLRKFSWYMIVSTAVAAVYAFAILPGIDGLPLLILVMAPYLLFFGALMSSPKWGAASFLLCVNLPLLLMVQARQEQNFASFINSNIAADIGIITATVVTAIIRSLGTERSIGRLLHANWSDLASLAEQPRSIDTAALVRRFVDRFGLLVQRAVALPAEARFNPEWVMSELRVGANIADLQRLRKHLPSQQNGMVATLLQGLGQYFRSRMPLDTTIADAGLLHLIDRTIVSFVNGGSSHPSFRGCLNALVGIRNGLFPTAPDFGPALPSIERSA